jgi:hypothetical protein
MAENKQSATTSIIAPIGQTGDEGAIKACKKEATKRLGGKDVVLVSAVRIEAEGGGSVIGATFRREWSETEAAAAKDRVARARGAR